MSQEHGFAVKRLQGHRKNALFASAAGSIAAVSGKACAVSDTAQRSRDKEVLESFAGQIKVNVIRESRAVEYAK